MPALPWKAVRSFDLDQHVSALAAIEFAGSRSQIRGALSRRHRREHWMAAGRGRISRFGPGLVLLAAMLWATDAPFRARLTHELPSNFIVFAEHGFDCLVAVPVLLLNWPDMRKLTRRDWAAVCFIAIGGSALGSIAFTESFHYVNPSVAILLQKVQPIVAILLAATLLGRRGARGRLSGELSAGDALAVGGRSLQS
jgi:drug/metabolite transporter (DMT)-like permease